MIDVATIIDETNSLKTFWSGRNEQLAVDRNYIRLAKPIQKTDQVKYVMNEPKVFFETSVALISSYPPRFRIPLTMNFDAEEKDRISKAERFVQGIFRSLDDRQYKLGKTFWLRELAWWVCSGWYAIFNYVKKDGDGTQFIADFYDPATVYPQWDGEELIRCIRAYEVNKHTAMNMVTDFKRKGLVFDFVERNDTTNHEVINYWVKDGGKVYNAILIDKQFIKATTKEDFDHIPIHVGAVGSPDRLDVNWQSTMGESVIAANRDMYDYMNSIISLMATITAETAYPNIISKTRTGMPAFKAEDLKGYGAQINLKLEEQIEIMKHASTPAEALQLLQLLLKQMQKGSIPDVVYGGVNQELSGFAISQLMAAIKYKIAPYLITMQNIMSEISADFLTQYKAGDYKSVKLRTTDPKAVKKGGFFVEEFTKKDVPDYLFIDVTVPITSALDRTQQIIFARQALADPQLISRETLWDEVLDIQDSEQEYARIMQDQMLNDPMVRQLALLEQLRQRKNLYEYQGRFQEAQVMDNYIQSIEMSLGMRQGIIAKPGVPGVSPSGMPPEMSPSGAPSPDMMGAALGQGPAGLNRPPQTAEQRAASQGRKGVLVSPRNSNLLK
uniref:Portal protein n=2 Tax=viral metagenome TaxID=1070528 RepID=A0A6M3K0X0_9ZZZZ